MIVKIVMPITVASGCRTSRLSMVPGVTPRPPPVGGAGGTGGLFVLTAACATLYAIRAGVFKTTWALLLPSKRLAVFK
jgi:hypothetical protein